MVEIRDCVVVASGGRCISTHDLAPIGHARLDPEPHVMLADLTRDRIKRDQRQRPRARDGAPLR